MKCRAIHTFWATRSSPVFSNLRPYSNGTGSSGGQSGGKKGNSSNTSMGPDTQKFTLQSIVPGSAKTNPIASTNKPESASYSAAFQQSSFKIDQYGLPLLNQKDCSRRLQFSLTMMDLIEKDKKFLPSILFSDEGNFRVFKDPSRRNKDNKRFQESQNLPVIVWCGMTSKDIVGPYFFNSYVTESSYLRMVKSYMLPKLKELGYPLEKTWFQQDGAPPHRSKKVLKYLDKNFENRLISYGCPTWWPAKSQDLTPLDYFLWNYLKVKVATNYRPTTTEDMKECISLELENIDPDLLETVVFDFRNRLRACVEAGGSRFSVTSTFS